MNAPAVLQASILDAVAASVALSKQPDVPDVIRLHASVSELSKNILSYVDMHREPLVGFRRQGKAHDAQHQERTLDEVQWLTTSLRTMSAHAAAVAASAATSTSISAGDAVAGSPAASPVGIVDLAAVVQQSTAEISAFCVEKYGVAPQVKIQPPSFMGIDPFRSQDTAVSPSGILLSSLSSPSSPPAGLSNQQKHQPIRMVGIEEHLRFVYTELLKNAMRAHIDRYSTAGVDDAPPISVRICCDGRSVSLAVDDVGGGVPDPLSKANRIAGPITTFPYFFSSVALQGRDEPNYQYSREFGVPFTGHGLGLSRCRLFTRFHGGTLALMSQPGRGTTAVAWFDRTGYGANDSLDSLHRGAHG